MSDEILNHFIVEFTRCCNIVEEEAAKSKYPKLKGVDLYKSHFEHELNECMWTKNYAVLHNAVRYTGEELVVPVHIAVPISCTYEKLRDKIQQYLYDDGSMSGNFKIFNEAPMNKDEVKKWYIEHDNTP